MFTSTNKAESKWMDFWFVCLLIVITRNSREFTPSRWIGSNWIYLFYLDFFVWRGGLNYFHFSAFVWISLVLFVFVCLCLCLCSVCFVRLLCLNLLGLFRFVLFIWFVWFVWICLVCLDLFGLFAGSCLD